MVIPYPENTNRRCDIVIYPWAIPLNKYTFLTIWRRQAEGRPKARLLTFLIPYSVKPKGIFDNVFSLGFIPTENKYPLFSHHLVVSGREKVHLKCLAMVIPYLRDCMGTFYTYFILCINPLNKCAFSLPLGVGDSGNPYLKLKALVIPYSGSPNETFDTVCSIGIISTNEIPLFLTIWGFWAGGFLT